MHKSRATCVWKMFKFFKHPLSQYSSIYFSSIYLFTHPSVHFSLYSSISLSLNFSIYLSLYSFINLPLYSLIYLFIHLSIYLFIYPFSIYPSILPTLHSWYLDLCNKKCSLYNCQRMKTVFHQDFDKFIQIS